LVVAFSGGRIDQTLANLQIAYEYSKRCEVLLAEHQYLIFPCVNRKMDDMYFPARFESGLNRGTAISLIPMEDGTIVSTNGLKYEINHALLRKGGLGISNSAIGDKVTVNAHKGGMLVFVKDA